LQTITRTPSGAVFGSTLGLLVFIYYASRFVLFVTAWAATSRENQSQEPVAVPRPAVIRSEVVVAPRPSGGTAAGLLGAGAVAGLLGALLIRRRCECASHCIQIPWRQHYILSRRCHEPVHCRSDGRRPESSNSRR